MYVLKSKYVEGEQYFTATECDLAFSVAKSWAKQGLQPVFYFKTFDGKFTFYHVSWMAVAA